MEALIIKSTLKTFFMQLIPQTKKMYYMYICRYLNLSFRITLLKDL